MITGEVVIDTAAGIHLVNDRKWLHDFSEISLESPYFGCGEYNPINIVGEGYIEIKAGDKDTTLVHAYYAPNETASIISADKLNEETRLTLINDYKELVNSTRTIFTKKYNNTIWVKTSDLLKENTKISTVRSIKPTNPVIVKNSMTLDEAHQRLNHQSIGNIEQSVRHKIFSDVEQLTGEEDEPCRICLTGKMTRHPHFKGSMNFYTKNKRPGESWSLDIFGPVNRINATSDRYMLVMVDNVSRYIITTTHKTKEKEEIGKQISTNINRIEKQFERSVKELISDQGKEFDNNLLKEMLDERGIVLKLTSTQDHSANARAERTIRTITTDVKTLLLQSEPSVSFWSYAAKAATDIRNHTFNAQVNDAPINILSKEKIMIRLRSFLPFGAPAIIWKDTKNKQRSPGVSALTLCKDPAGFGYLFYLTKDRKVFPTTNYIITSHNEQATKQYFNTNLDKKNGELDDTRFNEEEIAQEFNSPEEEQSPQEDPFEDINNILPEKIQEQPDNSNSLEMITQMNEIHNHDHEDDSLENQHPEPQLLQQDSIIEPETNDVEMDNIINEEQNSDHESEATENTETPEKQEFQSEIIQEITSIQPEVNDVEMNNLMIKENVPDDKCEPPENTELHENQELPVEIIQASTTELPEVNDVDIMPSTNITETENNLPQTSKSPILNATDGPKAKKLPVKHGSTAKKPDIRQFLKRNLPSSEPYTSTIKEVLDTDDRQDFIEDKETEKQQELVTYTESDNTEDSQNEQAEKNEQEKQEEFAKHTENENTEESLTYQVKDTEQEAQAESETYTEIEDVEESPNDHLANNTEHEVSTELMIESDREETEKPFSEQQEDRHKNSSRVRKLDDDDDDDLPVPSNLRETIKGSLTSVTNPTGSIAQRTRGATKWQKLNSGDRHASRVLHTIYHPETLSNR